MADESMDTDQGTGDHLWHNDLSFLDKNCIPVRSRAWYRKQLEMHMAARGKECQTVHIPQKIRCYQIAKGRNLILT